MTCNAEPWGDGGRGGEGRGGEGKVGGLNISRKLWVGWDIKSHGLKDGKDLNPLLSMPKQNLATS